LLLQDSCDFVLLIQGRINVASKICKQANSAKKEKHASTLSLHQFERAETEFEMRMQAGEIDFRVLVAKGVKVHKARNQMDKRPCYFFEIEFEGCPSHKWAKGDVYLVRRKDDVPQSMATHTVIGDFALFNSANGRHFTVSREYGVFGDRIRHPSMTVFPHSHGLETLNSTVLMEVEFEPRSLQAMHAHCLRYFRKPCVRALLLFKYFPQHPANRTLFEAVAVLYRRGPRGPPAVADAVSFGTAPFPLASLNGALPDVCRALRVLPVTALSRAQCAADGWAPALRPFLTVPAKDLHFLGDGARGGGVQGGAPAEARDLTLDLWDMMIAGLPQTASRLGRARPPSGPEAGPPPATAAAPPGLGAAPV
jgi:hypothetical protein